jgi:hypothetical protein
MSSIKSILGTSYNYSDHVANPARLKVSGSGSVDSLWKDVGAIASYVDTLTFGTKTVSTPFDNAVDQKPLGAKFFVKSGKCGDNSVEDCKGKDRYLYVNNIPDGKVPCLDQLGIKLPATGFKGLVPGMLGNIFEINPIAIFNSLAGKGDISSTCQIRTENVGSHNNFKKETQCSPKSQPVQCLPAVFEKFEDKKSAKIKKNTFNLLIYIFIFFSILFILFKKLK